MVERAGQGPFNRIVLGLRETTVSNHLILISYTIVYILCSTKLFINYLQFHFLIPKVR